MNVNQIETQEPSWLEELHEWRQRVSDREACWQDFEWRQLAHERWLHIRSGTIIPAEDVPVTFSLARLARKEPS